MSETNNLTPEGGPFWLTQFKLPAHADIKGLGKSPIALDDEE